LSHLLLALLIAVCAALVVIAGKAAVAREPLDLRLALPFGAFLAPAIWLVWLAAASSL
jgi:prepilin signal peptidase PulO-like enzyme (type II secretory pathway)